MRKALIIGIDYYEHASQLTGCVNDAGAVSSILERHDDGAPNFGIRLITAADSRQPVDRGRLKDAVRELFNDDPEIALLYFAGHGSVEDTGGYICSSEVKRADDGLAVGEIVALASASKARNKIIVLDSCHSGIAGDRPGFQGVAEVKEGMTILTASTAEQTAKEVPGGGAGVFTRLFVDALGGAAANLVGDVTPGSVYAHIDQSLGQWAQRPVFKTNVKSFVSLRRAAPPIKLSELRMLATLFPRPDYNFQLDPAFEPERNTEQRADPNFPPPDPQKVQVFSVLQNYARVNLVKPVGAPHMWHAAMQSKSCQLTVLGEHYQALVAKKLI